MVGALGCATICEPQGRRVQKEAVGPDVLAHGEETTAEDQRVLCSYSAGGIQKIGISKTCNQYSKFASHRHLDEPSPPLAP